MTPIIAATLLQSRASWFAMSAVAWGGGATFVASLAYFLHAYLVRFGRPAPDGPAARAVVVDVALFTAFALHHSAFARAGVKAAAIRLAGPRLERSVYTWIASALFIAVCAWWQPVPGIIYRVEGAGRWVAYGVQAAGIILTYLGSRAIDPLDLAGIRQVLPPRHGTAPARPPLVTSGVFRIVRHPLYFGWALLLFGAPTMTATRFVFAVVSTLYLAVAIPWEEQGLIRSFGPAYTAYRARVRWRMIPFLY
jgi:protein-S-isoprenylcysteine O-methyltransferase Ste14